MFLFFILDIFRLNNKNGCNNNYYIKFFIYLNIKILYIINTYTIKKNYWIIQKDIFVKLAVRVIYFEINVISYSRLNF